MNLQRIDEALSLNWRRVAYAIGGLAAFALFLVGASLLNAASADGLPKKGKVAAPADEVTLTATAARWSGPWVAGVLGYGIDVVETESKWWWKPDTTTVAREPLFGGAVGYDYQFAGTNLLVGIGADAMWARNGDAMWAIYGRGGVLVTPALLAYGGAGIADRGDFQFDDTKLVVLGGIEAMLNSGWFTKIEGRWLDPNLGDNSDSYAALLFVGYRFGAAK
jgi:hypothetical protein